MYDYKIIVEDLLQWYDKNARILPWRSEPKPYYVWVSEIMLQQTRVEAVKGYFARFIKETAGCSCIGIGRRGGIAETLGRPWIL